MKYGIIELHDDYDFDTPISYKELVRCKECVSYCGEGNKCLWGLLTVDMGYCHHGYRGGDCITEQTEPQTEYPTEWCEKCELWREDNCMGVAQCKRNIQILTEAYKQTEPQRGCDADCNEDCTECARESELWRAEQTEPQTDCSWK